MEIISSLLEKLYLNISNPNTKAKTIDKEVESLKSREERLYFYLQKKFIINESPFCKSQESESLPPSDCYFSSQGRKITKIEKIKEINQILSSLENRKSSVRNKCKP